MYLNFKNVSTFMSLSIAYLKSIILSFISYLCRIFWRGWPGTQLPTTVCLSRKCYFLKIPMFFNRQEVEMILRSRKYPLGCSWLLFKIVDLPCCFDGFLLALKQLPSEFVYLDYLWKSSFQILFSFDIEARLFEFLFCY